MFAHPALSFRRRGRGAPVKHTRLNRETIQSRIVRYLLASDGKRDAGDIRYFGQGLAKVPHDDFWAALRDLVEMPRRADVIVITEQATTCHDYHGFHDVFEYPVFWVLATNRLRELQGPAENGSVP